MPTIYTLKETAVLMKASPQTITRAIQAGQLKAVKLMGTWKVSSEEIERFMKEGAKKK